MKFSRGTLHRQKPGSPVSIMSDYRLDDRSSAEAKDFSSSLCVKTSAGAHPASSTMGNGCPFPGVKDGRGVTLTTHLHLVPWSSMSRSYIPSPPWHLHGVAGHFTFTLHRRVHTCPVPEGQQLLRRWRSQRRHRNRMKIPSQFWTALA
jgi:hypothetical protein